MNPQPKNLPERSVPYKTMRPKFRTLQILEPMKHRTTFEKRFRKTPGCWLWEGWKNKEGYGYMCVTDGGRRRPFGAHRLSWAIYRGPIADGMVIDHLCRNRACVNPDHMEVVANAENVRRGVSIFAENRRKTHCKRGHAFDTDNTRLFPDGHRACKACERIASAKRRKAR